MAIESTGMKPSELIQALHIALDVDQPTCIWGEPGVGKSQIVHQVGKMRQEEVKDIRAVLLDPVDLRGLPHINGDGRAHWAIPEFLPRDGKGILFLDELNRAPVLVQNACFQLILDRCIGEYHLPNDWSVVAACNHMDIGVTRMSAALANRFLHFIIIPNLDDWVRWAIQNNIEPQVIAFLKFRPELLHKFSKDDKAWPSPRSWEAISKATSQNSPRNIEINLYKGLVGEGTGMEYISFLDLYRKVPSIDDIVANPKTAKIPTEPAALFAVSSALSRKIDIHNIKKIITYLNRFEQSEYAVMAIKDTIERDKTIADTPEFADWVEKHAEVIF